MILCFLAQIRIHILIPIRRHLGKTSLSSQGICVFFKFPNHNLTVEAVSPALFIDKSGNYWDVPFSMAIDLASLSPNSGASYHLFMHHNARSPTQFRGDQTTHEPPAALLPGLSLKTAFSLKQNFDIWRTKAQKLKMVQPCDIFLSSPHVSVSGILCAAMTASVGDCSVRLQDDFQDPNCFSLEASGVKSAFLADLFASVSFTAQHGKFQGYFWISPGFMPAWVFLLVPDCLQVLRM